MTSSVCHVEDFQLESTFLAHMSRSWRHKPESFLRKSAVPTRAPALLRLKNPSCSTLHKVPIRSEENWREHAQSCLLDGFRPSFSAELRA
jgi:hypothetical protein